MLCWILSKLALLKITPHSFRLCSMMLPCTTHTMMRCFFTPQYIRGLKEEIRTTVEPQMPQTVQKASTIARIQQGMLERSKARYNRTNSQVRTYGPPKTEYKQPQQISTLWKDRQLRDYRKANGLCFSCGEKFVPGHLEVCSKRQKP